MLEKLPLFRFHHVRQALFKHLVLRLAGKRPTAKSLFES